MSEPATSGLPASGVTERVAIQWTNPMDAAAPDTSEPGSDVSRAD